MTTKTILLLLALVACGDNAPEPAPEPPPLREITGTATFVTSDEAGERTVFPISLHDTLVSAQFPTGDGWDVREGTSHADGTFVIHAAPHGDYWLEVYDIPTGSRQLLWTNATVLTFEERAVGRGDATRAGPGTTLTLGPIDGMDPAQADDGLELVSGNLGIAANIFAALDVDATTLDTTRAWAGQPLISAAKHDGLILTQLRGTQDPETGVAYRSPIKAAVFDSVEQIDRQNTSVTGTFTTPPDLAYDLNWKRSEFAAASAAIHPTRVGPAAAENFLMRAMPGGTGAGTSPFAALVLAVDQSFFGTDTTDLDQTFAIKNPYPEAWLFNDFQIAFPVTLPVPGVPDATFELPAVMEVNTNELAAADHPIVPIVTPPRAPTIDGLDLFEDREDVGVTPELAWAAPAQGKPTAYIVLVERWELGFGNSDLAPVATLVVPGDVTSVRMPAHVLEPGEHYVFRIAAVSQRGQDVRLHSLYTLGVPYGYAELVGNTITVTASVPGSAQ